MAQYYRIVHSVEELKSSCSNMGVENVQFVPVSSEEFQHHQVNFHLCNISPYNN